MLIHLIFYFSKLISMKEALVDSCNKTKPKEATKAEIEKYNLREKDPFIDNSFFSKLIFHWGYKLIRLANITSLKHEYVGRLKGENSSKSLYLNISQYWTKGNHIKGRSIYLTALRANLCHVIQIVILFLLRNTCRLLQVTSFHYYLQTFKANPSLIEHSYSGVQIGVAYLILRLLEILLIGKGYEYNFFLGAKTCAELNCLIYNKILCLSTNSLLSKSQIGEIVNYIQIDSEKLGKSMIYFQDILVIPYMIIFYCYLLYKFIQISFAFLITTLLLFFYLNYKLQSTMKYYQKECMKLKDKRLKISTETFNIIKMLKLYCWDKVFKKRIIDSHEEELQFLKRKFSIMAISQTISAICPIVISVVSIGSYQYFNNQFKIEDIFSCLNIFDSLERYIGVFPMYINTISEMLISMRRIEKFLSQSEISAKHIVRHNKENGISNTKDYAIKIDNCSFKWDISDDCNININNKDNLSEYAAIAPKIKTLSEKFNQSKASIKSSIITDKAKMDYKINSNISKVNLRNINIIIPKGKFVVILGEVGSGKSSLLQCIMNKMNFITKGKIFINGSIAFVDQIPWIMNDTIRNNILFHKEYNEEKYIKILSLCQLQKDINSLIGNDLTEIGDKGINLSGGQKVRINLARALYRDADILLLDDITASLDAEIGMKIMKKCIIKHLEGKTRLFVTNTVKYASYADNIVYMKDGAIIWQGTFETFKDQPYYTIPSRRNTLTSQSFLLEDTNIDMIEKDNNTNNASIKKLNKEEVIETGKVSKKVIKILASASGGCCVFFLIGLLMFCVEGSKGASNMWLEFWSKNQSLENNTIFFIFYSLIGFSEAIFMYMFMTINNSSSIKLSRSMHNSMIDNLINASVTSFHETVPKGQIINRLSNDINHIDHNCMMSLTNYLWRSISFISSIVMCSIYQPYSLIFLPFLVITGSYLTNFYLNCSRDLSRLDSSVRTPIVAHFIETLDGLDTIRAYDLKQKYLDAFYEKIDNHLKIGFAILGTSQWLKLYLDLLCFCFFAFLIITTMLYPQNYSIEGIGIILAYFIPIQFNLIRALSGKTVYESSMVNIERCIQYNNCIKEKPQRQSNDEKLKNESWPQKGHIVVTNLSARYRIDSEIILKNISFEIFPKEKIGIAGRTGSGKTTLSLCFFRIVEIIQGKISIDDVDISTIGLDILRKSMTIIPQEPVLIEGSLRYNIDPLNQYSDKDIIIVMKQIGFDYILQQSFDGLKQKLNDSGSNLSVGEKQLVCITRAILKKSKFIILDEATASIDYRTEEIIHKSVHEMFKESTVIMIAHRMKTIMHCDKILLLNEGQIVQFDTPDSLFKNYSEMFY